MKTVTLTVSESTHASAQLPATDTRTADQLLAQLLGGSTPPPTTPAPPIPFSHRGIPLGDFAALEAAILPSNGRQLPPVDPEDREKYLSLPPERQIQQWIDLVDKQFRRAED